MPRIPMADIRPFPGIRFNSQKISLSRALCPPYDVIKPAEARRLRREKFNAIHLELPEGIGRAKYRHAARLWKAWRGSGMLTQDGQPSFYVSEERFRLQGKTYKRRGFLAALSVTPRGAKAILPHERTLPKPKADRLELLKATRVNVSPIFGIFPDPRGVVRSALRKARACPIVAQGATASGVHYRLWPLSDPAAVAAIKKSLADKKILIADGHHRYEVSRALYAKTRSVGAETILAYLCPEEDPGLVVLSTHRIVAAAGVGAVSENLCHVRPCRSRRRMLGKLARAASPYAYGFYESGRRGFCVAAPKRPDGCRSGLCVEWVGRHLLRDISVDQIFYTPNPTEAERQARRVGGAAVFIKPLRVAQIRRAVKAVGLLPPKSTYFYPKIATGLVFKAL